MLESLKQKTISGIIWSGVQKFESLAVSFLENIVWQDCLFRKILAVLE